ncbi:pyridoxal phosphate-dependent aminotransferase [Ferrimicrobium acidiphilum]|uniref:Aminotransferase n=1 Tax=Ferrimicrobium acidiphilum DSM 19497 TaxID=1121877 RepID=A0A0D8FWK7_9ACTN|nr:pyridoxal phosphate-dependent aminotransferase [Ferrimicrobium acidiphilum]KJE77491.1 aspartate aminotransferase [Ferrimicrobium acidiphilum DSM 19497]MCL5053858.1 pyridoxal phosphate-dependent aminotransferase [Gammaproteobacteria bacterium]
MATGRISARIEQLNESATLAIDATAKSMLARGVDLISFAAGEPDFETPDFIVDAALEAARDPRNHHYTAAAGLPELRELIAERTGVLSGLAVEPSQVIVTNGGKHAVYSAMMTLLDEGDEVLIPAPYWVTYPEVVRLAGGVPVAVPTDLSTAFKVTPELLERYCTPRTKMLIHVSPSNPTGAVYSEVETAAIAEFADRKGLYVVSDEIYQQLTYGMECAPAIGSVASKELSQRLILVNGVAKTFAMTGWRVGWVVAPSDIAKGVVKLQSQLCSNVANISQRASIAALAADAEATRYMRDAFARRRQSIITLLAAIDGVEVMWPQGAFYAFPSVEAILHKEFEGAAIGSSYRLAELLLEHAKVAVIPGEAFDAPGYLRLSYALSDEGIVDGVGRIADFVTRL